MLVRSAALMILMATSPISAAGLLSEGTRAWFWKSLRWFLAALMIGPLAALVLAIGKLLTDGVLSGAGDSTQSAVGTAVVGTMLIIIGAFCPLILFRLLAFVDPGTSSGASFRASLDAAGGVGGLLQGGASGAGSGASGAATSQASNGTSQGEAAADTATQGRITSALSSLGGASGAAIGIGANKIASMGSAAATYGSDILGAAGVGHQQPYFGGPVSDSQPRQHDSQNGQRQQPGDTMSDPAVAADGTAQAPIPAAPAPPAPGGGSQPPGGPGGGQTRCRCRCRWWRWRWRCWCGWGGGSRGWGRRSRCGGRAMRATRPAAGHSATTT